MTDHPPARIAMCADPRGLHEHVPLAPGEGCARCFQPGCDCAPVVFVRESEVERPREALEKIERSFQRWTPPLSHPVGDTSDPAYAGAAAWAAVGSEAVKIAREALDA